MLIIYYKKNSVNTPASKKFGIPPTREGGGSLGKEQLLESGAPASRKDQEALNKLTKP